MTGSYIVGNVKVNFSVQVKDPIFLTV